MIFQTGFLKFSSVSLQFYSVFLFWLIVVFERCFCSAGFFTFFPNVSVQLFFGFKSVFP